MDRTKSSPSELARLPATGYPSFVRKLVHRPRRLRRSPALRNLVRQTQLSAHDFILPLFVSEKLERRRPVASMPGVFQFSLKEIVDEAQRVQDLGLQFPNRKTNRPVPPMPKTGLFKRRWEPSSRNVRRSLPLPTSVCANT